MKILLRLFALLCLCLVLAGGGLAWFVYDFLHSVPEPAGREIQFDVLPGASFGRIAKELEQKGLVTAA